MYLDKAKIRKLLEQKQKSPGHWMERQPDGTWKPTHKHAQSENVKFRRNSEWKSLPAMLGMSGSQLSNILQGAQTDNIKLATLFTIAKALGVHPGELLLAPKES